MKLNKQNSSFSFSNQKLEKQSDELLLLNLFKYFLNNFFCDQKAFQKLVGIVKGPMAISIFNKKNPGRLLCFWRDIPIYFHGESYLETNSKEIEKDSSFDLKHKFSSISLSTSKSDKWEEFVKFESDMVHIITLLPNHEINLQKGGPALNFSSKLKLEKSPTINAPKDNNSIHKSNLRSEIFEQPQAIKRLLKLEERHLTKLDTLKLDCLEGFEDYFSPDQRLVITGCGSSFFAGSAGARFFRKMRIFRDVKMVNSVEFDDLAFIPPQSNVTNTFGVKSFSDFSSHVVLPHNNSDNSNSKSPMKQRVPENICIAVSQSGESSDVLNFLRKLKESSNSAFVIALTNSPGSTLTKMANVSFFVNSGEELAVAATKSVTNTVIAFHMLALWFEYLFRGPRLNENTNFRTKGKFYQRIQGLPVKSGLAEGILILSI